MAPIYSRVLPCHPEDRYLNQAKDWFANLSSYQQQLLLGHVPTRLFNYSFEEEREAFPRRDYHPPHHHSIASSSHSSLPPQYSSHPASQHQPYPQSSPTPQDSSHHIEDLAVTVAYRQEGSINFYRDETTNRFVGHFNGHSIEIAEEDYNSDPDATNDLRIVEEEDSTGSEASTAIIEFNRPFKPDEFELPGYAVPTDPPAYTEHVEHQSSIDDVLSEVSSVTLESAAPPVSTEDKEPSFPYLKTRPGPSASNQDQKTRKTKGRDGKGRPRKSKHKRRNTMASQNKITPVATSPATSDMANTPSVRAASPAVSTTSPPSSDAGWSVVRRERSSRRQRAAAARAAANLHRGNDQPSMATVVKTGPAITPIAPPAVGALVDSDSSVSAAWLGAAETPRAGASVPQPNTQQQLVCEEQPAQAQDGTGLEDIGGESLEVARLTAKRAEQEEESVWEADCAHHESDSVQPEQAHQCGAYPLGSHSMAGSSSSHQTQPSEVVPSWLSVPPASDSQQIQQDVHPDGGNQMMQPVPRSSEYATWCGYMRSCCAHIPYWYQENPAGLAQPNGCCCNHSQDRCCLCLPPGRQWRIAEGAFFVWPESNVIAAIPEESESEQEAPVNAVARLGQSHALSSFTTRLPTQSSASLLQISSSSSFIHPPSPSRSLVSSISLPPSQLASDHPVATMTPAPTSHESSAGARSPSVTSTVKDESVKGCCQQESSGFVPLSTKKSAAHRVIPVVPLRLSRPVGSQRSVSNTTSVDSNVQGDIIPAMAALFDHGHLAREVDAPVVQVDSPGNHSRRDSQDTAQVNDTSEDSTTTRQDECHSLAISNTHLTAASIEPDLRSPSLYFDAKQQMSPPPAQSSASDMSGSKNECSKAMPSTPTPFGFSPRRSSAPFAGDVSSHNSPVKEAGPDAFPTPLRSRVSSRRSSIRSEAVVDTMGHVQSLWNDHTFADLSIVLQPNDCMKGNPKFTHVESKVFYVHRSIIIASPFLRHVIEFLTARDGSVSSIRAFAGPECNSAIPFRKALVTLYGKPLLAHDDLRHVTLKSMGLPDDNGNGNYNWSIDVMQVRFALSYAAAGAFLARREIVARGIELALPLLSWETAELMLYFAMDMRSWMITCPDIVFTPTGSPHSDISKAHEVGRTACHDFHFFWVEKVKHAVLEFFASNTLPGFKLYDRAQATFYPTRIPPKLWTLPNSLLSNPALEHVRFGSMPSFADRRPSRPDCLVVSGLLITLPFAWFMDFLEYLKKHNAISVALLREVVEQREERRLHALRIYHRGTWEPNAIVQDDLNELGNREFVSGELSMCKDDDAAMTTTSVQRVWVGLDVPNMNALVPRPLRQSDLTLTGTSTSQSQILTPTTSSQIAATNETTGGASDRGRQPSRKKKNKAKKKSKASSAR